MSMWIQLFNRKWFNPLPQDLKEENYDGRTVITTGTSSGLGQGAAVRIARLGAAKLILAVRDVEKGNATRAIIEAQTGKKDQVEVWQLEMAAYDSVVAFAKRAQGLDRLDVVVLNAGVVKMPFVQSREGWEETLQVNTLSTVLLAILLLPKLKASKQPNGSIPVLEFVSSGLHQYAQVSPDVLKGDHILEAYNVPKRFASQNQYNVSKLFLRYAAIALADRVSSSDVIITSICPGGVESRIARDATFPGAQTLLTGMAKIFMNSPEKASIMVTSGTALGEQAHGQFYEHGKIQPVARSIAGEENKKTAARVWTEIVEALNQRVPSVKETLQEL